MNQLKFKNLIQLFEELKKIYPVKEVLEMSVGLRSETGSCYYATECNVREYDENLIVIE